MIDAGFMGCRRTLQHSLMYTFTNLTKSVPFEWERSYNMGHKVLGDNTTNKVYINDRTMGHRNIIKFINGLLGN